MLKWLWLAAVCLMDAVGLDELYELYRVLVMQFEAAVATPPAAAPRIALRGAATFTAQPQPSA